jgi:CDP-diacylglycerol--glycerol-3-phosphate 3-phosphatidyltransferase
MTMPNDPSRHVPVDSTERFQLNVPNALCGFRLVGSLASVGLALWGNPLLFLGLFLLLAFTDLIDGKLAIWLNQRTTFGARFDSIADAAMYGALLFGCVWLKGAVLAAEAPWIVAALACYALSCLAALIKFGRLPSHHARSAKAAWLVSVAAGVALLSDWAVWPLRAAAVAVSLANLESTAITLLTNRWQADVPTVWHVIRRR